MSAIEFETQQVTPFQRVPEPRGGLTGFVINKGIVKTERQANLLFLGLIICAITYIGFTIFHSSSTKIIPPAEIQKFDQSQLVPHS